MTRTRPARLLGVLAGAAIAVAPASLLADASAQTRKPPPQAVPNEEPAPDMNAWRRAYDERGEPAILVVAGWGSGDLLLQGLAGTLNQPDRDGIATQLQAAFEQVINDPAADVELIDAGAARAAAKRLGGRLARMDEAEAFSVLADELSAQLVIVIRLLDYDRARNAPGRVVVEAIDPTSARTLFSLPFEWKLGSSAADLKRYANVIAARFIEDYAARAVRDERYTVRVIGLAPGPIEQRDIVRGFEGMPGVRDVRPRSGGLERDPLTGEEAAVATYSIRAAADPLELQASLAEVLADAGIDAEILDTAGTSFTLRVYGQGAPRSRADDFALCAARVFLRTDVGERERERIREAYAAAGAPTVAVLVNRRLSTAERDRLGDGALTGDNVIVIGDVNGRPVVRGIDPSDVRDLTQLESQNDMVEAEVQRLLGARYMDFSLKDTAVVRAAISASLDRDRAAVGQDELIGALRSQNIADVAILGSGRIVGAGAERRYEYTLRAVDLRDSSLLGTSTVTGGTLAREPSEPVAERLARRAMGELLCELAATWSSRSAAASGN